MPTWKTISVEKSGHFRSGPDLLLFVRRRRFVYISAHALANLTTDQLQGAAPGRLSHSLVYVTSGDGMSYIARYKHQIKTREQLMAWTEYGLQTSLKKYALSMEDKIAAGAFRHATNYG